MNTGAVGIILNSKKQILLTKRSDYTKDYPHHWTFPGGRSDQAETPEETVIREVKEEVGLDFIPTQLFQSGIIERIKGQLQTYRFLGDWSGKVNIQAEEAEGYAWFTYEETTELKIAFDYTNVIEMLHEKGLL